MGDNGRVSLHAFRGAAIARAMNAPLSAASAAHLRSVTFSGPSRLVARAFPLPHGTCTIGVSLSAFRPWPLLWFARPFKSSCTMPSPEKATRAS